MADYEDFLPSIDGRRQRPAPLFNDSSGVESTAAAEAVGVALYPVVTWFAVLLTLTSVGLVGNVVVVVALAAGPGRGGPRRRRRSPSTGALVVHLSAALVASCVVLSPLQFAVVAENYVKRSVSSAACRAAAGAHHLLCGTVVSSLVLLALLRRRRLRLAAAASSSSHRRSSSSARSRRSATGDSASGSGTGTCPASCRPQLAHLRRSSATDVLPSCRCSASIDTIRRVEVSIVFSV